MTILYLTNSYLPTPLANGVCVHSIAKECVERGYDTHVICYGSFNKQKPFSIDGVNIHKVRLPLYYGLIYFYENHKSWITGKMAFVLGRFCALLHKLIHFNEYPLQDASMVRRMVSIGDRIIKQSSNPRIKVVSSYTPLEGIKAGANLKKKYPQIELLYYSLDTLSNEAGTGVLSSEKRRRKGIEQEIKYFALYDKVLLMNCHRNHYNSETFLPFRDKIFFADFPLYRPKKQTTVSTGKSIVYAGSLYRVIRNPSPALQLLEPILDNYTLHFYGHSDCDDIIEEFSHKHPGHIINHGLVAHEVVLKASDEAEILLSIGNAHTQMAPSKIYEQMATGKPIIHTYAETTDTCLPLLKQYKNSLCVDINNLSNCDICSFIKNIKTLTPVELDNLFVEAKPSFTVNIIDNSK